MRRAALSCLLLLGLGGKLLATPGASADPEAQRRIVVPGRYLGPAFDTCRAPTDGEMADVKRHSRFRGVGVYLGGVQRKCTQPALTAGWVRRQVQRGWHVFPLWVGPQASCSAYENRMSSTRKVAFAQGRRQATAAIAAAGRHAIARGSTLYYDLEYYDISGDRCRRAALAFMSGWTKQLRDKGFRSGIYSSVTAAITSLNFADE